MARRNVAFIRPELAHVLHKYRTIRHVITGSDEVKRHGTLYLPMPNAEDKSKENKARYNAYKTRAMFYNFTGRTIAGLMGQVFARSPVSEIPNELDRVEANATGGGVTLEQLAKLTLGYTLSLGRSGLLVDYPTTGGAVTAKQVQDGEVRPTITAYDAETVVNWRVKDRGAKKVLSLVVIAEIWPFHDDGFEIKTACQFRVLWLDPENDDNYTVDIWREPQPSTWVAGASIPADKNFELHTTTTPLDPNGKPFNEIPFMFVGVNNNDESIDNPPLWDLADLNIGHYRNSADYEEACYMLGQPTYWFSGLTEAWVDNVLKGQVRLGSTGGVLLPENASAGLLQPEPNTMVKEAMDAKERQAVALGAKLVEQQQVQRTATEAGQEHASETSILSTAAKNVSAAYRWALIWCGRFMGLVDDIESVDPEEYKYELNSDFAMMNLSPQERAQLIKEWQSGAISFTEMRAVLRRVGVATADDEQAMSDIKQEQIDALTMVHTIENAGASPTNKQPAQPANGAT
jgi:hypothetical protein